MKLISWPYLILILVIALSGCGLVSSTPQVITDQQLPTPSATLEPTATRTLQPSPTLVQNTPSPAPLVIPTVTFEGMMLDQLPKGKDFIIYHDYDQVSQQWGYWAINPVDKIPILFYKGGEGFGGLDDWSPNRKYRLLQTLNALFLASPDGRIFSQIYSTDHYQVTSAMWLSDSMIIINAYEDFFVPAPDIYTFNVDTGLLTPINLSRNGFVQSAFPSSSMWIEVDWITHETDLVKIDGSRETILEDFKVNIGISEYVVQWIEEPGEFVFMGKRTGDENYKIWAVSKDFKSARMIYDLKEGQTSGISISPDHRFIMFNFSSYALGKILTKVVDLSTGLLEYEWIYPYEFSEEIPIWSPDSQFLACPYSSSGPGTLPEVSSGIQIMNIKTGATEIIVNSNVGMQGWEILNP